MEVIVALIAAAAAITSAGITRGQNRKINETHKQVSENSHQNDKPTILDLIADVREEQRRTNAVLIDHLEWHADRK